ncbi:MAG: hypothetical protein H7Y13_00330 [Sphingobacteriaceae bacterium]|nr:hypothetical protein [Sphingobacteriaceae bacterium]
MESIIYDLYLRLNGEDLNANLQDHHLKNFILVSHDDDGSVLHGFVKQVTPEDYHVFVREKDVIVGYKKLSKGVIKCTFGSNETELWVEQIAKKLANRIA